jgi:hypothetical protein
MRRIPFTLAILVLMSACCSTITKPGTAVTDTSWARECPDAPGPKVCINPVTGVATPDPKVVHRGDTVHFFFSSSNNQLSIDSDVLEDVRSLEGGHASGHVKVKASFGEHKYTIHNLTSQKNWDPTLIIDP